MLTPRQIVEKLDEFIIGQDAAKRSVAIALRSRWRKKRVGEPMRDEITPNNILIKGPTGTGKTEIARRLAKIAKVPFTKTEAYRVTEVGYVGGNADDMIHDLANNAVNIVKEEQQGERKNDAEKEVENILLDTLIPPLSSNDEGSVELNHATRDRFREKLKRGELDQRMIEIKVQAKGVAPNLMDDSGGQEVSMISLSNMLSNYFPKREEKRKVTIKEARKLLLEQQYEKILDFHALKEEARKRTEEGIVFIDEIDKLSSGGQTTHGPSVSREGAQRELLGIVEGTVVNTKVGPVKTDHILFIAAGAFHQSKPSDLMPELLGRFPIREELKSLTKSDLEEILTKPKNSIIKQYVAMFKTEGVELSFTPDAVTEMAELASKINHENEDIGARRLRTIIVRVLDQELFDMPEELTPGSKVVVDAQTVRKKISVLLQEKAPINYMI